MAGGEAAAAPHPAELEPGAGLLPARAQLRNVWAPKPDFGTWSQLGPMCPECLADELRPLGPAQVKYSDFINGLQRENIGVNRKMLSELAANEPYSFKALVDQVRSHAVPGFALRTLCPTASGPWGPGASACLHFSPAFVWVVWAGGCVNR